MRKKIGVYAGSFNPFHVGHADILHQSLQLFDEVIIAIGKNTEKVREFGEREPFPTGHPVLGRAHVAYYNGLLSDFLNELDNQSDGDNDLWLVRGLRNDKDLPYEQNFLQFLKEMYPGLRVVFLKSDRQFEHVSSSALRALKKVSEKEYLKYVYLPIPEPEKPKYGCTCDL